MTTDPLRAEVERLSEEWEKEAARRRKDAARPGEPPSSRRFLECGAAFELTHAAALRAALRSTEPPAGLKSEEYRGGAPSPSPRQEPRGDYAPCHGCFFYQGKHSPRCDARGERVAPGVPCSDCRPIPRHSSLDCPVCRPAPEEAATLPKRSARPLTGDALKDACRRLSPPPALEDMDIATPEEAATGTREPKP